MFALTKEKKQAEQVGLAMKNACMKTGTECELYISPINKNGPQIL